MKHTNALIITGLFIGTALIVFLVFSSESVYQLLGLSSAQIPLRYAMFGAALLLLITFIVSSAAWTRKFRVLGSAILIGLVFGMHSGYRYAKSQAKAAEALAKSQSAETTVTVPSAENRFWRRGSEKDFYWAREILKGGYILHFRHAHRDMDNQVFGDTVVFDALDMHEGFKGVESRWRKNICLNAVGERQASGAKVAFEAIGLPVSVVVSSPNCRALQTAELAFGKVDETSIALHLRLLFDEKGRRQRDDEFVNLLTRLKDQNHSGNIVLVGHNGTIGYLGESLRRVEKVKVEDARQEMGFTVISISDNGELVFHYEFSMLRHFILAALPVIN